ncbi:MAG TPA: IS66 family insertion sequence element accessory protein TnpB [Dehalococcoidia bacterium]|nr:IS66 family insertion sequence element accessory protein TnpB [Dehalococcoidia bacterium]
MMLSLPHPVRVFLHIPPTDLRKGFDALSGLVTTAFGQDLTSGHLFLFVNRRRDRLKILYWDRGDGLAIWYKRLEIGSFQLPERVADRDAVSIEMSPTQLALILSGIDLRSARQRKRYQRPTPEAEKSIAPPCHTG